MESRLFRHLALAAAVKLHGPHLLLAGISLARCVVNRARRLVDGLDLPHLIRPALQLIRKLRLAAQWIPRVEGVAVHMREAIAPAQDEELLIADKSHIVGHGEIL